MEIKLNDYIDFKKLFFDLFKQCEEDIYQYQFENDTYFKLIQFYNSNKEHEFDIETDECYVGRDN